MSGLRIYFEEGNEVVVSSCGPGISAGQLAHALGVIRDVADRLDAADRATLRAKLGEVLAEPLTAKPMTDAERACYDREFREKILAEHPAEPERPWAVGDECEFQTYSGVWVRATISAVLDDGTVEADGPDLNEFDGPADSPFLRRPGGAS